MIPLINQQSLVGAVLIYYIQIYYKFRKFRFNLRIIIRKRIFIFYNHLFQLYAKRFLHITKYKNITEQSENTQMSESLQSSQLSLDYFIDIQNSNFIHKGIFQNIDNKKPWQVLNKINQYLIYYFKKNTKTQCKGQIVGTVYIDEVNVQIGEGTVIQHGAMIKGPCIIGKNCQIRKGAYIRGNAIIGDNVIIGNSCEVKNSIIMNNSQVPHFNYVGDSILGTKSHLSAGAITSNFRLDGKNISIAFKDQSFNTNVRKFGAIVGDRSQVGCNVVLNPGSLIGKDSWIYPNVSFRGFLQSNRILKLKQQQIVCQKKQIQQKK